MNYYVNRKGTYLNYVKRTYFTYELSD